MKEAIAGITPPKGARIWSGSRLHSVVRKPLRGVTAKPSLAESQNIDCSRNITFLRHMPRKRSISQAEARSRLAMSADRRFLLDAGWFWHPWCGACVFDMSLASGKPSAIGESVAFSTSNYEIDSAAFLGSSHLVISSASEDAGEELKADALRPKQLGVWSLIERRWESKVDLNEQTGAIMPWKKWIVSFYDHPKLIELGTGQIVHQRDQLYFGKQVGPIDLGDPPPPPMAIDWHRGRFALANATKITVVAL